MMIINAKIKISEEKRDEYLKLMEHLVSESRKEEGVLFYSHYEDVEDRNTFIVVENYVDEAAIKSHNESEHLQMFKNEIGNFVVEAPVIEMAQKVK